MNKICTSIEQSKKLAEFLPLESADMHYPYDYDFDELENIPTILEEKPKGYFIVFAKDIPCWSLAALLGVIKPVNDNTYTLKGTLDGGAIISFEEVTNVMFQEEEIIDAAFEMVVWLKENKKL